MVEFTAEQKQLAESVRDFTRKEVIPIAQQVDQNNEIPWDFRKKMANLGYFARIVPKELGGQGLGVTELCIQEEELAYGSATIASSTMASTLFQTPLYLFGTKEQMERFMIPIQRGEAMGSFGLTEPKHGSDFASIESTAVRDGSEYVLNGSKRYIDNTAVSRFFTVWVKTDVNATPKHKGVSLFIVERDHPGFVIDEINDVIGLRGLGVGGFSYKDCRIPKANLVGEENQGFYYAMTTLERGRTPTAAICIGLAQAALDAAKEFAKSRVQFGQPIANFQMIKSKIADMATAIEASRLLTYRAAKLVDARIRSDREACMAKLLAAQTVMMVSSEAVQIFGARGCMKEFPVERFYRDARIFTIGEGTLEMQRLVIARRELES